MYVSKLAFLLCVFAVTKLTTVFTPGICIFLLKSIWLRRTRDAWRRESVRPNLLGLLAPLVSSAFRLSRTGINDQDILHHLEWHKCKHYLHVSLLSIISA
jgi:hypothetical protein